MLFINGVVSGVVLDDVDGLAFEHQHRLTE
jgi:hypothetical protein